MTRIRNSLLTMLAPVAILLVIGCDAFVEQVPPPNPPSPHQTPTPLAEVDAAAQMRIYELRFADALDASADQFERHAPEAENMAAMGAALKKARIESFMPIAEKLNALRPGPDATDEQRTEADLARAKLERAWAKKIREGK